MQSSQSLLRRQGWGPDLRGFQRSCPPLGLLSLWVVEQQPQQVQRCLVASPLSHSGPPAETEIC
eukprot:14731470-Alexandrium_andersonii.AAC.1